MSQPIKEEIESMLESEHEDEEDSFEYDEEEALGDPEAYYGEQKQAA